jgi:hypothetical protein
MTGMREWLVLVSEPAIALIDAMALLVILIGTIEVSVKVARASFKPLGDQIARQAWLRYARWLVAGLTLQLAPQTSSKPRSAPAGRPSPVSARSR